MRAMKADLKPARRAAVLTGMGLALGIGVAFFLAYESGPGPKGIGIGLVLEKQNEFRQDLTREARHLNELEIWQIQEEIARRAGLTRSGVKGLVQRARNSLDPALKLDAMLLAGDHESVAALAKKRAENLMATDSKASSVAFRQAGDGFWRNAQYQEASDCYGKAGPSAQMDLALLHWAQANFHPEDVRAELDSARSAVSRVLMTLPVDRPSLDSAAANRLMGNVLLRLAMLQKHQGAAVPDAVLLKNAETALRAARDAVKREVHPELWAAVNHDLGVALLERSEYESEPFDSQEEAAQSFDQALQVRTGLLPDGAGKADMLALRLSQRAETLAYQAVALSHLADVKLQSGPHSLQDRALAGADLALGLSQPEDPGLTWFMAQYAKLRTIIRHPTSGSNDLQTNSSAMPVDRKQLTVSIADSITAFERALENYPDQWIDHPAVPTRAEVIALAEIICQNITRADPADQSHEWPARLINAVESFTDSSRTSEESPAFIAARKTMAKCLELKRSLGDR